MDIQQTLRFFITVSILMTTLVTIVEKTLWVKSILDTHEHLNTWNIIFICVQGFTFPFRSLTLWIHVVCFYVVCKISYIGDANFSRKNGSDKLFK
eukprot:UN00719